MTIHIGDRVFSFEDGVFGRVIDVVDAGTDHYEIEDESDGYRWIGLWGADFRWADDDDY